MANQTRARLAKLIWGRAYELPLYVRCGGLAFVIAAIVFMSFCQLGFFPLSGVAGHSVFLILLLAPVLMGSVAFGPILGGVIGLFGGAIAFYHANNYPLDFLEAYYFSSPVSSIAMFGGVAVVAGLLFDLALRLRPSGIRRAARITLVSLVASLLASAISFVCMLNIAGGFELYRLAEAFFGLDLWGSLLQALIDGVLVAAACLLTDLLVRKTIERGTDRKLYPVFRNFLALVSVVVFMTTGAVIFMSATVSDLNNAAEDMNGDLEYLQLQMNGQPDVDVQLLLGNFSAQRDGAAFAVDPWGVVVASNNSEKFGVGTSVLNDIGEGDYYGEEGAVNVALDYYSSGRESLISIPDSDDEQGLTMTPALLGLRKCKSGYVGLYRTADIIFANRFGTMVSLGALAFVLVSAIAILASILVRRLIVRRIDQANESLAKITEGDLAERVPAQDTREFTSLADGINTTVVALGNMIDEVERRNEQDLATAKTIQESSLPTVFPPFPDIHAFDIFASMRTAREVGGDFYDFFLIDDTTKVGFVMADVSGKGIPAALFMMAARSELRNYMEAGLPLDEAVLSANHQLCLGNDAGMFVTCWVGVLDYATGELDYVNGGHNPPLLMHDGAWSWLRETSGLPLGTFDGLPYEPHSMRLEPGDTIFTYTDGVTEAMNVDDELYGDERLEAVLGPCAEMDPRSIDEAVHLDVESYTKGAEQSDDITMLTLRFVAPEGQKSEEADTAGEGM